MEIKYLCTGNKDKFREFRDLSAQSNIELNPIWRDLEEIDSEPLAVISHKASQVDEGVLVEDTSLDVEGEEIGILIRWALDKLDQCIGKRATWTVLLAERIDGIICIYRGKVPGRIVSPRGVGSGFDPCFLPDGSTATLAESKPRRLNARAIAFQAFLDNAPFAEMSPTGEWRGPLQTKTFENV